MVAHCSSFQLPQPVVLAMLCMAEESRELYADWPCRMQMQSLRAMWRETAEALQAKQ